MNTQLFIPTRIKVGFNMRNDTYTGKLGYVIAKDGNKWRKENSWEGWREKYMAPELYEVEKRKQYDSNLKNMKSNQYYTEDKIKEFENSYESYKPNTYGYSNDPTIEPVEYDNAPIEGFVLNKKVGGYRSDWNVRQTKSRVYDPRGFEFEISIENLLYILQETNSIKGKGLEGEFVYAWDGKDLVLLPSSSPDYQKCVNFNNIQKNKVSAKELVPGGTYLTKREKELIYLGKFDWFTFDYKKEKGKRRTYELKESNSDKFHMFFDKENRLEVLSSLSSLSNVVSDTPVDNYAELIEVFNKQKYSNKVIKLNSKVAEITFPSPSRNNYYNTSINGCFYKKIGENHYVKYSIYTDYSSSYDNKTGESIYKINGYQMSKHYDIKIDENGNLVQTTFKNEKTNVDFYDIYNKPKPFLLSQNDILNENFEKLYINFENGREMDYEEYSSY